MRTTVTAAVLSLSLLAAACGDDTDTAGQTATTAGSAGDTTTTATEDDTTTTADEAEDGASTTTTTGDAAPAGGGELTLASTSEGDVLTDADGMALYLFMPDQQGASTCYDQCAQAWPPLTEAAGVGDGLDAGLVGTTTRDDGTVQATYNGWPLYHFASDTAPGDVNGQGVNDVWYLVDASGEPVGAAG